jgi:hypothetical protein
MVFRVLGTTALAIPFIKVKTEKTSTLQVVNQCNTIVTSLRLALILLITLFDNEYPFLKVTKSKFQEISHFRYLFKTLKVIFL